MHINEKLVSTHLEAHKGFNGHPENSRVGVSEIISHSVHYYQFPISEEAQSLLQRWILVQKRFATEKTLWGEGQIKKGRTKRGYRQVRKVVQTYEGRIDDEIKGVMKSNHKEPAPNPYIPRFINSSLSSNDCSKLPIRVSKHMPKLRSLEQEKKGAVWNKGCKLVLNHIPYNWLANQEKHSVLYL